MAAGAVESPAGWSEVVVKIPVRVLEAKDCDERLSKPPSWASLEGRSLEFEVPPDTSPGAVLRVPVQGEIVLAFLPANASPGDTVYLQERADGSWRCVVRTVRLSVLLPECCDVGARVEVLAPDGGRLGFAVPDGAKAGDVVRLNRLDAGRGPWAFTSVRSIPDVDLSSWPLPEYSSPAAYASLLEVVRERGCLSSLPLTEHGRLHVSVPFCGGFLELGALSTFFAGDDLRLPTRCRGVTVCGTEVFDSYAWQWAVAAKWCRKAFPGMEFESALRDLAADPLPDASLTLAIHPEVTKGGSWFPIIGNIVESTRGGLCVFATFFEHELKTLRNMLDMYRDAESRVEVIENPYYEEHDKPASPDLRFIVLLYSAPMLLQERRQQQQQQQQVGKDESTHGNGAEGSNQAAFLVSSDAAA